MVPSFLLIWSFSMTKQLSCFCSSLLAIPAVQACRSQGAYFYGSERVAARVSRESEGSNSRRSTESYRSLALLGGAVSARTVCLRVLPNTKLVALNY